MNNFSKIQERHIAANKYRFECQNVTDMKCECGQPASEHRYGTSECLGCDNCKKFKREMKNADDDYQIGDHVDVHGEVGVVVKVKGNGVYMIRFHYGVVEVEDRDIEGISSHFENAEMKNYDARPDDGPTDKYSSRCKDCKHMGWAHTASKCDICGKNCESMKDKAVQNADPATCKSCKHGMDEHNADGDCMNCGKTCGPRGMNNASDGPMTQSERRRALANQFRNADEKLKCPKCDEVRGDVGELQRHLIGAHNMSRDIARAAAEGVKHPEYGNAYAYIYVGDKVKLKSEPDTTWTVTDFAGDTYVLRGPKGSRQARLDQLERVSL